MKELKELKYFSLQNIRNPLLREAKTMLNISPHESVPVFNGVIVNSRPHWLVMQLCTRSNKCLTLLKVIKNMERLNDLCLHRIIGKLAEALHHVHKNGFLHNDLKLDNVAVIRTYEGPTSKQWLPMILDFGEATRTKSIFKRRYNSHHNHIDPLVLRGEAKHSVESDIFSFGMILKSLATMIEGHEDAELAKRIAAECTSSHRRLLRMTDVFIWRNSSPLAETEIGHMSKMTHVHCLDKQRKFVTTFIPNHMKINMQTCLAK